MHPVVDVVVRFDGELVNPSEPVQVLLLGAGKSFSSEATVGSMPLCSGSALTMLY
jgi:hypothetical protein